MKKILLTIALLLPLTAIADAARQVLMFNIGVGFGESGRVVKTEAELANPFNNKFCFHRPSSRMVYGSISYRYKDAEAHVARWFNETDTARCNRDSWATGLGYVLDTQNINRNGPDDAYATYTPGIAYTWGKNKEFNVQDNTNTNWRLKDNWQMYNRFAVGQGNRSYNTEVAIIRYGLPMDDYERTGENFMTVGVGYRKWKEDDKNTTSRGLTPPPAGDTVTIIVEDNTVIAPPSEPVTPEQPPQDQTDGGSFQF